MPQKDNDLSEEESSEEKTNELREKRTRTIVGLWKYCRSIGMFGEHFELSIPLTNEVIEHYLMDCAIIKIRYKISDKIQPSKVAGLMTSLFMRYRPIIPLADDLSGSDIYVNELFAILHGLAICGEFTDFNELEALVKNSWFERWLNDFIYLLHYRNHTPEALSFIYETLCMTIFQSYCDTEQPHV